MNEDVQLLEDCPAESPDPNIIELKKQVLQQKLCNLQRFGDYDQEEWKKFIMKKSDLIPFNSTFSCKRQQH